MSDHVQIKLALPDGSWLSLLQGPGSGGNTTAHTVEVAWVRPHPYRGAEVQEPIFNLDAFELSIYIRAILSKIKQEELQP